MTEATQTSKALTHNFVTVPRKSPDGPTNLVGLTRADLREVLVENGTPEKQANMRVSQIWQWIYEKGVRDFDQMTNLAKPYRENLKKSFQISVLKYLPYHWEVWISLCVGMQFHILLDLL